jgi:perosamine synthetase
MNKAIFITARSNSSRLKNKMNIKLANNIKILEHSLYTKYNINKILKVILCTTDNKRDDKLEKMARGYNLDVFRGSENDKIKRYYDCCEVFDIDYFVNIDGDDPFTSFRVLIAALSFSNYDYVYEKDMIVGSFTFGARRDALKKICEIKNTDDTEMIHRYFTETGLFNCMPLTVDDYIDKEKKWRFTIDYKEDLDFFNYLLKNDVRSIKEALEKFPESYKINSHRNKDFSEKQLKTSKLELKNPPKHSEKEIEYITKVFNQDSWSSTGGSWVNSLEKEFAQRFNAKYAVAMNSGTATLHSALYALGVGPGDEVITPALSVFMDTSCIIQAGATPVYADINMDSFLICYYDIESKITERTKAIIAVSLYGLDIPVYVYDIAKKYNIPVIDDHAQHFAGELKGSIASYSFETTKHISCGEGGIIITNDEVLAERCRKFAGHGFKNLRASEGRIKLNQDVFQDPGYKRHEIVGYNYRMPEFNAAIALAQLERLDDILFMRRICGLMIDTELLSSGFLISQKQNKNHSYYSLAARFIHPKIKWQEFRKKYIEFGGDGIYGAWSLPYNEPAFNGKYDICHNAEIIQPQIMQFKTNYRLSVLAYQKVEALNKTIKYYS